MRMRMSTTVCVEEDADAIALDDWSGVRAQAEAVDDEDERDRQRFKEDADAIASDDWMDDASVAREDLYDVD
jgi:hypothetical protein